MADIGKLALELTADAGGLVAGLGKAERAVSGFAARTGALIKQGVGAAFGAGADVAAFAERAFANPLRTANGAILGTLGKLASSVPLVGGVLALPFEGLQAAVELGLGAAEKGFERIRQIGGAAARVGVGPEDLTVFEQLTGSVESAEKVAFKFQQAMAGVDAAAAGAHTPLTQLGLAAKDVAGKLPAERLEVVADALRRLRGTGVEAAAARALFGRGGGVILPRLLVEGVGGVRGEIDALGLNVDAGAAGAVRAFDKARKTFDRFKTGLFTQIGIAAAPIVAQLSEELLPKLPEIGGLGDAIRGALEGAAETMALFVDAVTDAGVRMDLLSAAGDVFTGTMLVGIGKVIKELPGIADAIAANLPGIAGPIVGVGAAAAGVKFGGGAGVGQGLIDRGQAQYDAARAAFDAAKAAAAADPDSATGGVGRFFDRMRARLGELKAAGQSAADGAFGPLLEVAGKLDEAFRTPLDKVRLQLQDLARLDLARNLAIGQGSPFAALIGPDVLQRAAAGNLQALRQAVGVAPELQPIALEGSKEAAKAILESQFGRVESVEEQIRVLMEAGNQQREEQIRVGREALDAFRKLNFQVVGG